VSTEGAVPGAVEPTLWWRGEARGVAVPSPDERAIFCDTVCYLPDDILVKVDRASMGVSLELRAPLLDHRVLDLAWELPHSLRIREGRGKWLLRRMLDRYVPAALTDRPKTGFSLPVGQWLRGPLREWAESLLAPSAVAATGVFEPRVVRDTWTQHLSGEADRQLQLWPLLMFQAWHDEWHRQRATG
jgi:asparagine synthase (glutamine-hydrolysing)